MSNPSKSSARNQWLSAADRVVAWSNPNSSLANAPVTAIATGPSGSFGEAPAPSGLEELPWNVTNGAEDFLPLDSDRYSFATYDPHPASQSSGTIARPRVVVALQGSVMNDAWKLETLPIVPHGPGTGLVPSNDRTAQTVCSVVSLWFAAHKDTGRLRQALEEAAASSSNAESYTNLAASYLNSLAHPESGLVPRYHWVDPITNQASKCEFDLSFRAAMNPLSRLAETHIGTLDDGALQPNASEAQERMRRELLQMSLALSGQPSQVPARSATSGSSSSFVVQNVEV